MPQRSSGLADRTASVCARRASNQTSSHRCRRTAGGAAGHAVGAPGVAHRTKEAVFVGRAHGELIHIGFANAYHSSFRHFRDDASVVWRDEVAQHLRARCGQDAIGAENVFMGEGAALSWVVDRQPLASDLPARPAPRRAQCSRL